MVQKRCGFATGVWRVLRRGGAELGGLIGRIRLIGLIGLIGGSRGPDGRAGAGMGFVGVPGGDYRTPSAPGWVGVAVAPTPSRGGATIISPHPRLGGVGLVGGFVEVGGEVT